MRAHVIEGGVVANTIEVESLDVFPDMLLIDAAGGGQIGDHWDGQVFTPPASPPEPVPFSVSMRQCRLELHAIGKLATIPAVIAGLPEGQRDVAEIEWEYSPMVERQSPLVPVIGYAIGRDDAGIDDLFRSAVKR